jgi:GDPmannose 4,6-dehydratase
VLNLLESIRVLGLKPKIYQASTSELYDGLEKVQNEKTPFNPVSPYGTAKLYALQICKNYRDAYGMFIVNGILFNHESPRRGVGFVTQKIVQEADNGEVHLGNVDAERDWGYAPEYMEAAWRMLQQKKPRDYIVATGETHSIKDFVKYVEKACGHKIKIITDKDYIRPVDVPHLKGDPLKANMVLKWKAKTKAKELAKIMYENRFSKT